MTPLIAQWAVQQLRRVDFGHRVAEELERLEAVTDALNEKGYHDPDLDLAIRYFKSDPERARRHVHGPTANGDGRGALQRLIDKADAAPEKRANTEYDMTKRIIIYRGAVYRLAEFDLDSALEAHKMWVNEQKGGKPLEVHDSKLAGADLSGRALQSAMLSRADLSGANLSRANLLYAELDNCKLGKADLSGAHLAGATMAGVNAVGANFSGANLKAVKLTGSNLKGAKFTGADLSDARMTRCNLAAADLANAKLYGADLAGCNLAAAVLPKLGEYTNLRGAKYDDRTQFAAGTDPEKLGMKKK